MPGTQYALSVANNSSDYVDLCVYQTQPNLSLRNVMSLAWFAEPAWPTTTVKFEWTINYSFVWDQTGMLIPGVVFDASQSWPADPSNITNNQVYFTYSQNAYTFQPSTLVQAPEVGNLYIQESGTIPLKEASVGIGMSGAGTFVVQAEPNKNLVFSPHPEYWITAGTFQPGQVLDVEQITNSAALQFPPGVFELDATLNLDNTWTVTP